MVMLADEMPEMEALGPKTVGGCPLSIMVYVEDVDGSFERALNAGAKQLRPVADQFYRDRSGQFETPRAPLEPRNPYRGRPSR